MNPRVPMGHLRTEIMSNSCDPQAWEHGGDEETADVARRKGAAPRRDGLRRGVRRDFGRWGQPAAPRPASPMVEFLKTMAKYGFRLQRGTGDQGGKTQYTHTISIHSYHKSICIGNGMTVASTHYGLLFTPGVHRLLGPCEGRRSWRRPNDTQSATSNCYTHDG